MTASVSYLAGGTRKGDVSFSRWLRFPSSLCGEVRVDGRLEAPLFFVAESPAAPSVGEVLASLSFTITVGISAREISSLHR